MKLGKTLATGLATAVTVGALGLAVSLAHAQDVAGEPVAEVDPAEAPVPEVVEAWATPAQQAADVAQADTVESDAFAHIHDADEALVALQQAERMVGFDLLDGVR